MMDKISRKNMAANFITFGNNIIFSSPDISDDIIRSYCEKGFNCITPPFQLTMNFNDGIRCHTQEVPTSIVSKITSSKPASEINAEAAQHRLL